MNWPHCPTAQHSDQTHPAPNPQFTLCNILTAILMATLCWHSNQLPTSLRLEEKSEQKHRWKWIREKVFDQQKVLRESLIKCHICGATWSLLALALRKHTLHWPRFTERKKGTLLFRGKTDSLVQRNTTEGKNASLCSCQGPQDHGKGRRHRWTGNKEDHNR